MRLCLLFVVTIGVNSERLYQATRDRNDQYVRVMAEVVKLTNEKGLTANNAYCDTFGACDPICYAYLDTDRPNAEWPGGISEEYWPKIYSADNLNSPPINKLIQRDSCAKPFRDAVLRVKCEDYDPASHNDVINQWQCAITRSPAETEASASWSPVTDCVPKFHPGAANSITLTFRYKLFHIQKTQCDASAVNSTPRPAAG